ncbi:MAG: hypothetical protein Q9187_001760 [Circinaria calcarea]
MSGSFHSDAQRTSTSSASITSTASSSKPPPKESDFLPRSSSRNHEDVQANQSDRQEGNSNENVWSNYRYDDGTNSVGRRRRGPRTSGGFLLESPLATTRQSRNENINRIDKGKGKDEGRDGFLSTRRTRHTAHHPKPSIGSSPLAIEVTHSVPQNDQNSGAASSSPPVTNTDTTNGVGTTCTAETNRSHRSQSPSRLSTFDTDPAQIVNLALNLSESRRRHLSLSRLSPVDPVASRRIMPNGQHSMRLSSGPMAGTALRSLTPPMQELRRTSRSLSSRTESTDREGATYPTARSLRTSNDGFEQPIAGTFNLDIADGLSFNPSDATLLRVERAQLWLELSYEYRRLLQYLPKLPTPSIVQATTVRGATKKSGNTAEILGRSYNPLQYIRNRKFRGRERKNFDTEAGGWKDLARVRNWVDSVARERQDQVSKVDDKFLLPSFGLDKEELPIDGQSPTSSLRQSRVHTATKPPRARLDQWATTPWDLLADAYWLDQDDNKRLIEDRDGNKIYPLKKANVETTAKLSLDISRPGARRSTSITRPGQSPSKGNPTIVELQDEAVRERGRRRHQFRNSITSLQEYSSSQDRKGRWSRKLLRSRSSSSSEDSRQGSLNRQGRFLSTQDSRERQDSAVLERQVMDLLAKEAENLDWGSGEDIHRAAISERDKDAVPKRSKSNRITIDTRIAKADLTESPASMGTEVGPRKASNRNSLEEQPERRGRMPRASLEEFDNTSATSPVVGDFVPSIAISLSPPMSRSTSPKRSLPARQIRAKGSSNNHTDAIAETDFANKSRTHTNRTVAHEFDLAPQSAGTDGLSTPSDGFLSPRSAEGFGRLLRHRRSDSKPLRTAKDQKEPESRLKGLLKSSRIAVIVGNEVSKVGDILWGRDGSNQTSRVATPTSSHASDASDSDGDSISSTLEQSSSARLPRMDIGRDKMESISRQSTHEDSPKYHMSNLPSFRSPLRKYELDPRKPHEEDHITRQQTALRERGRSSRVNRPALLNLDMRGVSPSPSPPLSRVDTHDTSTTNYESRRNSENPSESGVLRADRQFNTVKGLPAKLGNGGPPVTELASLDARRHRSRDRLDRPALEGKRHWSISDRGISAMRGVVTKRDITRARALLLSSGVKANEIARRAHEVRDPPPTLLLDLQRISGAPLPPVPRSQEHVVAARFLVKSITETNAQIRQAAVELSNVTVNGLHEQIKVIDERITSQLTPLVRAAADDADALGTELGTSYRLSIKRLNDSIDQILRRKRRRFRWLRRGGYLLLEWVLLGVMRWIWLMVVLFRLASGVLRGTYRGIRWLLWM